MIRLAKGDDKAPVVIPKAETEEKPKSEPVAESKQPVKAEPVAAAETPKKESQQDVKPAQATKATAELTKSQDLLVDSIIYQVHRELTSVSGPQKPSSSQPQSITKSTSKSSLKRNGSKASLKKNGSTSSLKKSEAVVVVVDQSQAKTEEVKVETVIQPLTAPSSSTPEPKLQTESKPVESVQKPTQAEQHSEPITKDALKIYNLHDSTIGRTKSMRSSIGKTIMKGITEGEDDGQKPTEAPQATAADSKVEPKAEEKQTVQPQVAVEAPAKIEVPTVQQQEAVPSVTAPTVQPSVAVEPVPTTQTSESTEKSETITKDALKVYNLHDSTIGRTKSMRSSIGKTVMKGITEGEDDGEQGALVVPRASIRIRSNTSSGRASPLASPVAERKPELSF